MAIAARYHRLRNRGTAIADHAFAEPVKLFFKKNGSSDPNRPDREIEGILRVRSGDFVKVGAGSLLIHAQPAELFVSRVRYPDLTVVIDDLVRALARPGQPWFEVLGINDRTDGRLVLRLGVA